MATKKQNLSKEEWKTIAASRLERLKKKRERESRKVPVPIHMLDDLLAYIETGDDVAVRNVAATIKELAEDEHPDKFKTHRHG